MRSIFRDYFGMAMTVYRPVIEVLIKWSNEYSLVHTTEIEGLGVHITDANAKVIQPGGAMLFAEETVV